jgi:VWFA-related protein
MPFPDINKIIVYASGVSLAVPIIASGSGIILTTVAFAGVVLTGYMIHKIVTNTIKQITDIATTPATPPMPQKPDVNKEKILRFIEEKIDETIKNAIKESIIKFLEQKADENKADPKLVTVLHAIEVREIITEVLESPKELFVDYGDIIDIIEIAEKIIDIMQDKRQRLEEIINYEYKYMCLREYNQIKSEEFDKIATKVITKNRNELDYLIKTWQKYINELMSKTININVTQIDTTKYPIIIAYASIFDAGNRPIAGLRKENFFIMNDGYKITNYKVIPLSEEDKRINKETFIHMLFDTSGSMQGEPIEAAKQAGKTFIEKMRNTDKIAISSFNITYQKYTSFTNDRYKLEKSIAGLIANGGTALYDSIIKVCEEYTNINGRKALIVLSDGQDNQSMSTLEDAIKTATENSITIFVIALGEADISSLKKMAHLTGGQIFITPSHEELETLYKQISELIKKEYKIEMTASKNTKLEHELYIRVKHNEQQGQIYYYYELK